MEANFAKQSVQSDVGHAWNALPLVPRRRDADALTAPALGGLVGVDRASGAVAGLVLGALWGCQVASAAVVVQF